MSDILSEAKRCLKCKKAFCKEGCPVHTDIPTIMQLFLDGKMDESGETLFNNNPLSAICSLICPHENNCMYNSPMENFFGILKNEMFYGHEREFKTLNDLKKAIEEYIKNKNK